MTESQDKEDSDLLRIIRGLVSDLENASSKSDYDVIQVYKRIRDLLGVKSRPPRDWRSQAFRGGGMKL